MHPAMTDIVYGSSAELSRPGAFLREAVRDLRAAPRIGRRLFAAQLRGRSRRSVLGYLWLVLPAAAVTVLCLYLQSLGVLASGPTGMPYPLYVLAGVLLWQIFVEALNQPVQQLLAARHLISRSPVPHEAILLGAAFDVLLSAAVRLALLLAASWFYAPGLPGPGLALGVAALILFGFSIGLWVAPWALLYDDARHALTMATTFWFFLTPIAYRPVAHWLIGLNPVTPLLETARSSLAGGGVGPGFAAVTAAAAILLLAGWLLYRLARPHIVERLG
jgi:lipopolysaccharide transport system permease protein